MVILRHPIAMVTSRPLGRIQHMMRRTFPYPVPNRQKYQDRLNSGLFSWYVTMNELETDSSASHIQHPYNDQISDGYCFDCGLPEDHNETLHAGRTAGTLSSLPSQQSL